MSQEPELSAGPVLTVVTIVRNDAAGLLTTADSVRSQVRRDFEWIIVDGASTDATVDVLVTISGLASHIISEPDEGIYDAMNKGLQNARGTFVLFMNAGDAFATENAVAEIIASSLSEPRPDLIIGASIMLLPGGLRLLRRTRSALGYIRHGLPALHQAIAFRTSLHRQFPYPRDYAVSADYAVVAWMLKQGARTVDTGTVISINEIGGDSFSYRNHREHLQDVRRVQEQILELPQSLVLLSQVRGRVSRAIVTATSAWSRRFPRP